MSTMASTGSEAALATGQDDEPYELYYFPAQGRCELSRLILNAAGMKYTDRVVKDWPAEKESTPFGQVPVLIVKRADGTEAHIAQSAAINRFLARKAGFVPTDPVDYAQMESVYEACFELVERAIAIWFKSPDAAAKEAAARAFLGGAVPAFSRNVVRLLDRNGPGATSFFKRPALTLAEFGILWATSAVNKFWPGALGTETGGNGEGARLLAVADKIAQLPPIQAYVNSDRRFKS